MKTNLKILAGGALCALCLGVFTARATLEIGVGVEIHAKSEFYVPLTAYGSWVEVSGYGHCWQPAGVAGEWEPYCNGQWMWTDCGWYWESDEPWAWACYHYGRWVYDSEFGWVWVPDVVWAPAWVSWRCGGGYIGWAPLPPAGFFFARVAAPSRFLFVEADHFTRPVRRTQLIVNNTTIIHETTQTFKVERETRQIAGVRRKVIFNQGPGVQRIEQATHEKVDLVPIQQAVRRTQAPHALAQKHERPPTKGKRPGTEEKGHANSHPPPGQANPPEGQAAPPHDKPQGPAGPDLKSHGRNSQGDDQHKGRDEN
jgi:Family of unknown function (DUF6600)